MIPSLRLPLLLVLGIIALRSAEPTVPPTLDKLEATYHANLMLGQEPIMKQYVLDLQALLQKSPEAERDAIRFEIARIQKLIADGTPIDLTLHNNEPGGEPPGSKKRGIVFTLDPDETKPPHAKDAILHLGTAVWPFSKLAAGKYELVGLCACPGPLPAKPVITVTFHGITSTVEVTARTLTKSSNTFRQLTFGSFTLPENVTKEDITVTATGDNPWLFVKQLRLIKAKE